MPGRSDEPNQTPPPKPIRLAVMVLVLSIMVTGGALLGTFPEHRLLVGGLIAGVAALAFIGLWQVARSARRD